MFLRVIKTYFFLLILYIFLAQISLKLYFKNKVKKYPPNAIYRSANINAQCSNVTGSMNWHNNVSISVCSATFRVLTITGKVYTLLCSLQLYLEVERSGSQLVEKNLCIEWVGQHAPTPHRVNKPTRDRIEHTM